jgi:hypothetical protein
MGGTVNIFGYVAGYAIQPDVSYVSITSTGVVGGTGLVDGTLADGGVYVTVANRGAVFSSDYGVALWGGGQLTNGSTEHTTTPITGDRTGVEIDGFGFVANFGTIVGDTIAGVTIVNGAVTNGGSSDTTALIRGVLFGVQNDIGAITNFGSIIATGAGDRSHAGVTMSGALKNGTAIDTGARIEGYNGVIERDSSHIDNFGTVVGNGAQGRGIYLTASGASVTNGGGIDRSALIEGMEGIALSGVATSATIANFGTILGAGGTFYYGVAGVGLRLTNGSKTNATALIEGYGGVEAGAASTIVNFGSMIAEGDVWGAGVYIDGAGVHLTNGDAGHRGALIEGYVGMKVNGTATITNYASIVGQAGTAVDFLFAGDTLLVEAGCVFEGAVIGGGGMLVLASGTGSVTGMLTTGTVTVSGSMATTAFTKFNTLEVGAGATFAIAGSASLAANQRLFSAGTLTVAGGIANAGLMETLGKGVLTVKGAVSGAGTVKIAGGVADFLSSFNQNVTFTGATGVLELGKSQTYLGTVTGLSKTGTNSLDLVDIAFISGTTKATFAGTAASGTLTVTDGTHTAKIKLAGNYVGAVFTPSSDGHGGTKVVDPTKLGALPPNPATPVHRFIEAASGFGVVAAGAIQSASYAWKGPEAALCAPRTRIA